MCVCEREREIECVCRRGSEGSEGIMSLCVAYKERERDKEQ